MVDIAENWLDFVKSTFYKYMPGVEVRAFGSRVTGKAKKYSDLDLVIMCWQPLRAGEMTLLKGAFEESKLPIRIDIIEWSEISDSFREIIENNFEIIQQSKK